MDGKIAYKDWSPKKAAFALVIQAEEIIEEYEDAGYVLTLRQLYYQFVARGIIENTERSYKNLGNIITKARMAGMISWLAIEDRNRQHHSTFIEEDIMTPIKNLPYYIHFDRWERQDTYVEVWVEKEALGNVVERACREYDVPHMSCKGYLSASEAWRAGQRFEKKLADAKDCVLIHLGDHDPSGIDMTRDNQDRLDLFTREIKGVKVHRIALNMDQVNQYKPPPNPTKITDTRAAGYMDLYGNTSWELDALEPQVIEEMIKDEIIQYIDWDAWEQVDELEKAARETLENIYGCWEQIEPIVGDN